MDSTIYTKQGRPLRVRGDDVFSRSGTHVARIRRDRNKAYGPEGRYVGTLVGDRLIYRSTDSAAISSPFARRAGSSFATANRAGTGMWGEEPPIADWRESRKEGPRPQGKEGCSGLGEGGFPASGRRLWSHIMTGKSRRTDYSAARRCLSSISSRDEAGSTP
jgi:hypothetical protein